MLTDNKDKSPGMRIDIMTLFPDTMNAIMEKGLQADLESVENYLEQPSKETFVAGTGDTIYTMTFPDKAILKASEPETQEWCSKLVGTYDKKKVSSNYNADILGVGKGQGTSSSTEEKRIIKPEEFAYLKDVVCVFPNGYKRLQKANYYEDKTFTDRM